MPEAPFRIRLTGIAIGIWIFLVSAAIAFAQESQGISTFQAADVRKSAPAANPAMQGGILRGGRIEIRRATVLDLIKIAYGADPDLVFGGPNWIDWDRFDVAAKSPVDTPPATVKLMLRALLADRFKLMVHRDTRPVPASC